MQWRRACYTAPSGSSYAIDGQYVFIKGNGGWGLCSQLLSRVLASLGRASTAPNPSLNISILPREWSGSYLWERGRWIVNKSLFFSHVIFSPVIVLKCFFFLFVRGSSFWKEETLKYSKKKKKKEAYLPFLPQLQNDFSILTGSGSVLDDPWDTC